MAQGACLIDVREQEEYDEVHIPGCVLIPLLELSKKVTLLDKKQETILYCHSGSRSAHAVKWLKQQGFLNVKNLDGGIVHWIYEKLPVEKSS